MKNSAKTSAAKASTIAKCVLPAKISTAKLSVFARRLLEAWRKQKLPMANKSILVAVSGGADSAALLLALNELITTGRFSATLIVAHLDHSLRSTSRADAKWVANLAGQLGNESVIVRLNVK